MCEKKKAKADLTPRKPAAAEKAVAAEKQKKKPSKTKAALPEKKEATKIEAKTLNGNKKFKHVDNARPDSPIKIPGFAINLLASGHASQNWKVANDVKGLVLLSDPQKDSYVDSEKVESTLKENAKHFEFVK